MRVEIVLPDLGEDSVENVTISGRLAAIGATLREGDDLLELTTDKAAFTVPCPRPGTVAEWKVDAGDVIRVGEVICVLDVEV